MAAPARKIVPPGRENDVGCAATIASTREPAGWLCRDEREATQNASLQLMRDPF